MLSPTNRSQHFENRMKINRFRAYLVKKNSRIHNFDSFQDFFGVLEVLQKNLWNTHFLSDFQNFEIFLLGRASGRWKGKKNRNWERVGGSKGVKSTKKLCFWYFLPLLIPFDPPTPHPIPLFLSFWSFWCSSEQIGPNILKIEWKLSNWEHI